MTDTCAKHQPINTSPLKRGLARLWLSLRWIIVATVAGFLLEEFIRVTSWVIRQWGFFHAPIDGAVIHKLGELLIILPFMWFVHWNNEWPVERSLRLAQNMKRLILAGVVFNGLAIIDLYGRVEWVWWPIFLVLAGLFLSFAITRWAKRSINWRGRGWGGGLAFLFVLHYALSFITSGSFVAPLPASIPWAAETEEGRWQQDLEYLRTELPRMHLNAFHTTGQQQFDQLADDISADIPDLAHDAIRTKFKQLVATVGDAHTRLDWPPSSANGSFPLDLLWFSDGLYVVRTIIEHEACLASRLIRINETDIGRVYDTVGSLVPNESDAWTKNQSTQLIKSSAVLESLGVIDDPTEVSFVFVTPDSDTIVLQMAPITPSSSSHLVWPDIDKPLYKTNQFQDHWFEHFENTNTLYFKYNSCMSPIAFPSFSDSLWEFVDKYSVEYMIIDLRNNGGGNTLQFSGFFEKLKAHGLINQPGRLYVIVNRSTFSAASDHAVEIKRETDAILVGEPMGGGVNQYGDMRRFWLPNSDLQVNYSVQYFELWPDSLGPFEIDVLIEKQSSDHFSGRDPVLDSILQLIQNEIDNDQ